MQAYRVSASLIDPVTQRKSRQSQISEGLIGIRGTTLRGALARAYLDEFGTPDERFERLFLDERKTRFGSLQPWQQQVSLTATSCKRAPGFASEDHSAHGVVDLLWFRIAEKLNGGPMVGKIAHKSLCCQHQGANGRICGAALTPFSGGWTRSSDSPTLTYVKRPSTSVNMHVGIDRGTSTAAPAILFALQSIVPSSNSQETWNGVIHATEESWSDLRVLLDAIDNRVRIGHAKTRGYGRIELQVADEEVAAKATGEAEWDFWSVTAHQFLNTCGLSDNEQSSAPTTIFSITFPSGAIIVDQLLRYSLDPSDMVDWLPILVRPSEKPCWSPIADCPGSNIRSLSAVTRHEMIRGWQAAHGLPKADEYALVSGAVYAYEYQGQLDWLWNKLDYLRRTGVGLRRNEGFGDVFIGVPFHQLCKLSLE